MRAVGKGPKPRLGAGCVAALLASALGPLGLCACGGASTSSAGTAAAARGASSGSATGAGAGASAKGSGARRDTVSNGVVVQRPRRGTGGAALNDDNPARADSGAGVGAGQLNPCTLVSQAQAQAILGGRLEPPQEAPLGPTCIYRVRGSAKTVTLAVEPVAFARLASQMRGRTHMTVAGHRTLCGFYGQQLTVVALPRGGVLQVVAPCAEGARLAAIALGRFGGRKHF
jgi:hypothetical protein